MQIESWPIDRPKPYGKNPRRIPERAVQKVAASIREYGFRQPIVVDEAETILVGHTRLLAARSLGLAQVPVHVAVGLSPAQARAYRLADNRTNEEAAWDMELLGPELFNLKGLDFDLKLTGFNPAEIETMLRVENAAEDEAPEPPVNPVSRLGDLWLCDQHLNPMGGNKDEKATGHGTQKPVELFRRPILNHTVRGEAVYDPFLGSGTCLIAAELTERVCYGLEISEQYVDVIVKRWMNLTQREATLAETGQTFSEISNLRQCEIVHA